MFVLILVSLSILLMILSLLFFPKIKLGKINLDTYYIITLIGALILIIFGKINIESALFKSKTDSIHCHIYAK